MKQQLRKEFIQARNKLDSTSMELSLRDNFLRAALPTSSSKIASYYPINSEADVEFLNCTLLDFGHKIFLPCIDGKNLTFRRWQPDYEMNEGKIPEPINSEIIATDKIDLFIIPLVAFDESKTRLGYGGGFYDLALQNIAAKKIGVGFEVQKAENLPHEEHDIKLDMIITESNIYK